MSGMRIEKGAFIGSGAKGQRGEGNTFGGS
jgi:hypothetical protein